ncbi:hypothetical protein SCG7109_AV_00120 [Chlamydiales bacterium SCGC AG-110-M15]|nr:hypothetical protein SCG7109_AV_00120 [Chlamydiales bacterium SCGC AG-110-M15]
MPGTGLHGYTTNNETLPWNLRRNIPIKDGNSQSEVKNKKKYPWGTITVIALGAIGTAAHFISSSLGFDALEKGAKALENVSILNSSDAHSLILYSTIGLFTLLLGTAIYMERKKIFAKKKKTEYNLPKIKLKALASHNRNKSHPQSIAKSDFNKLLKEINAKRPVGYIRPSNDTSINEDDLEGLKFLLQELNRRLISFRDNHKKAFHPKSDNICDSSWTFSKVRLSQDRYRAKSSPFQHNGDWHQLVITLKPCEDKYLTSVKIKLEKVCS